MLRDSRKFLLPVNPLIELVLGNVEDRASVDQALIGCTHVIHAAALTAQNETDYNRYHAVNVLGTENVWKASQRAGIKKFVFVSTANTLGYGTVDMPGNEGNLMRAPFLRSLYAQSKKAAERLLTEGSPDTAAIIVHPTFLLGAYDAGPSSGKILTMIYNKRFVLCPPGGKNFIHVQDAAKGVVKALMEGRPGEKYLLANENLSYREFFDLASNFLPRKPKLVPIPRWLLKPMGYAGDFLRSLGLRTSVSSVNMAILGIHNYYDNSKARKKFQIEFQSTRTAIEEAIRWFEENRMV
jgi:nucleoside-diphosphate-sugar epimerase